MKRTRPISLSHWEKARAALGGERPGEMKGARHEFRGAQDVDGRSG